ncbi:MAG: class A beta-lactamase [Acidobacteriota bacterium]|nr:class A beta-lactamase [Acidobacteriota bacterium]
MGGMTRRTLLVDGGLTLAGVWSGLARAAVGSSGLDLLPRLEEESGGRLGVAYVDTGTGRRGGFRSEERFPMCSTFKLLLAGAVLRRVDEGSEQLERVVRYGKADLLGYAPATAAKVDSGMTVAELCGAAVSLSDNTAANVLLASIGGPAAVTAFVRTLGDSETRLDRNEPTLNTCLAGDPRDTTTPAAMMGDVRELVLGKRLTEPSKTLLTDWLVGCKTGDARLRAGMPAGVRVGDKTGTGADETGTANDVAVIWPEGRAPWLISVYLTGATVSAARRDAMIAEAGRMVAARLGSSGAAKRRVR